MIKHKSATVNLENLLLEKYLREKETKKNSLEVRAEIFQLDILFSYLVQADMLRLDERIAGVSARLSEVGTTRWIFLTTRRKYFK